jgi:hypothetical protein
MCSACLPNVDNENIHATAVYIRFPLKRLRVVFFLTGPACPCGIWTLASQPNKLCFVDYIHAWLSVSWGNRIPGPNNPSPTKKKKKKKRKRKRRCEEFEWTCMRKREFFYHFAQFVVINVNEYLYKLIT